MGRIFEALQRSTATLEDSSSAGTELGVSPRLMDSADTDTLDLDRARPLAVSALPEHRLVMLAGQRSLGAEKIRFLGARLRQIQDDRLIKKLLITSTIKDEGKTVLSANLALSLAKTKQRVLLIDGDCHLASATRLFGGTGSPGLTDWWRSDGTMQKFLTRINGLPLWFLPAGRPMEQPLEMLQAGRLAEQLDRMSSCFDWIIIDSPPCAALVDAAVWSKMADGILMVARQGKTPKRLLKKILGTLDQKKLIGIVLNDCSDPDQRHYTQYYNLPDTHQA